MRRSLCVGCRHWAIGNAAFRAARPPHGACGCDHRWGQGRCRIEDRRHGGGRHQGVAIASATRQDAGRGVEEVVEPRCFCSATGSQQTIPQHVALPPQLSALSVYLQQCSICARLHEIYRKLARLSLCCPFVRRLDAKSSSHPIGRRSASTLSVAEMTATPVREFCRCLRARPA
jgi:hypothetical protein